VTTLVNDYKESGSYKINFDASSVANGIYLYKLEATPLGGQTGNFTSIKKMIVLK
jgi:hypothetical protein